MTVKQKGTKLPLYEEARVVTQVFLAMARSSLDWAETDLPGRRAWIAHLEAQVAGLDELEYLP
jgi:hypothetical protein